MITAPPSSPWLFRPRPQPAGRIRLFCFPYSGAGASIFVSWAGALPPGIELCAVQLPGRETRLAEPPERHLDTLVERILPALGPYLEGPFAFFGHSMGALLAFELARALRRSGGPLPALLVASGHRAPHLPDPHPPAHALPEPELLDELRRLNGTPPEVLEHPELRAILLPILRADFAVCETYAYRAEPPLACPITAFGGLEDGDVTRDELAAWREQTTAGFSLRMFPGDHFFCNTARPLVLHALARELAPFLAADRAPLPG